MKPGTMPKEGRPRSVGVGGVRCLHMARTRPERRALGDRSGLSLTSQGRQAPEGFLTCWRPQGGDRDSIEPSDVMCLSLFPQIILGICPTSYQDNLTLACNSPGQRTWGSSSLPPPPRTPLSACSQLSGCRWTVQVSRQLLGQLPEVSQCSPQTGKTEQCQGGHVLCLLFTAHQGEGVTLWGERAPVQRERKTASAGNQAPQLPLVRCPPLPSREHLVCMRVCVCGGKSLLPVSNKAQEGAGQPQKD